MKKTGIILTACALFLFATQCKKNNETNKPENESESVCITLNVGGGTKTIVVPGDEIATVYYAVGDMIHVVSDGKYIGTLTYNGSHFTGDITNPTEGQPLHFYFLGNVTPSESLVAGETSTCSVVISDQTTSHPVISYAPSNQSYRVGATHYTATLLNKCALVKFNVTTVSENATCIIGMNNKVTVDFETNEFDYSQEGDGVITLSAGEGEKWVILLPQDEVSQSEAHSADGIYTGTCASIPVVAENDYQVNGIVVDISHPVGAINGLYTINENGDRVFFSQGNLQYQASTNTWRFAENQWNYVGENNTNISETYSGWIDLFGWGTGNNPTKSSKSNSDYRSFYDWGNNSISNGNNNTNQWRTLTKNEWVCVFLTRNTNSGIRFAKAKVNDVCGIILLPDNWSNSTYSLNNANTLTASFISNVITGYGWNILENAGAVFLPTAGRREGTAQTYLFGSHGYYWMSTPYPDGNNSKAYHVTFRNEDLNSQSAIGDRWPGESVRLVQDY